ncbi:MAG TPA: phage terminase large subunit family protein [Chloroflexia bacterium]|nr:phage terminase large subunit family protein [Chloroflexia bacterium]
MEADSRAWMMRCPNCGHERSVWEMGGIRWGAAGEPRRRLLCPQCGKKGWHKTYRKQEEPATEEQTT